MEERAAGGSHKIVISNRKNGVLNGVIDVLSFDVGEILLEKERYKEAVNIYQDALRYNPVSYDLNYNLGIAYTMLNDFQNAKTC